MNIENCLKNYFFGAGIDGDGAGGASLTSGASGGSGGGAGGGGFIWIAYNDKIGNIVLDAINASGGNGGAGGNGSGSGGGASGSNGGAGGLIQILNLDDNSIANYYIPTGSPAGTEIGSSPTGSTGGITGVGRQTKLPL